LPFDVDAEQAAIPTTSNSGERCQHEQGRGRIVRARSWLIEADRQSGPSPADGLDRAKNLFSRGPAGLPNAGRNEPQIHWPGLRGGTPRPGAFFRPASLFLAVRAPFVDILPPPSRQSSLSFSCEFFEKPLAKLRELEHNFILVKTRPKMGFARKLFWSKPGRGDPLGFAKHRRWEAMPSRR